MKILLIILLLSSSVSFARDSLFFIERSKNKNQVHYGVKLTKECSFEGEEPVFGFWKDLEEGPNVTSDFSTFDHIAYGIQNQEVDKNDKNQMSFNLKAIEARKIKLILKMEKKNCTVLPLMEINKKWVKLEKVYVFAVEGLIKPTVKYIDLFGFDEEKKQKATERIKIED